MSGPVDGATSADGARRTFDARLVRASAGALLAAARADGLGRIAIDENRFDPVIDAVIATTRAAYPTLDIPFHARWRHFRADGRDLWGELDAATDWPTARARLDAAYDLAIVSVLLDAGAGMGWRFREPVTGAVASKSEGLALASLVMFRSGAFSADPRDPLRCDAGRLAAITAADLEAGFQVRPDNPLIGLEGRAALIRRLGETLLGHGPDARPSLVADTLLEGPAERPIPAPEMLTRVLEVLAPIWPARAGAIPGAGDVWPHPAGLRIAGSDLPPLVAFHKLSQWLTYSLIEPLTWIGRRVSDVDGLTGLPEYRNGGLFLDLGLLRLKDPADMGRPHEVGSTLVVEWRALTVACLDIVAERVRAKLGLSAEALPLAKVLEGGTWAAGRRIAAERRADGGPPLTVLSDGTVF